MKRKSSAGIAAVCLAFVLTLLSLPCAAADTAAAGSADGIYNAYYSSPAFGISVGDSLMFSSVTVQFTPGGDMIPGSKITWRDGQTDLNALGLTAGSAGLRKYTASYNGVTRDIYVVIKEKNASEYVLYSNDFSSASASDGLRVIQQTAGATVTYDAAAGTMALNADLSSSSYLRVLLPEFLDGFGDAIYSARVKMSSFVDETKWSSLMYRVQNGDYPYMQACMRYNTSAANGTEIAQRTASDAWSVTQKGPVSTVKGDWNEITVNAAGKTSVYYMNSAKNLTENATPYDNGAFGLQVRGACLTVESVKVTLNPAAQSNVVPGRFADTDDPDSGISLPPVLVTEVNAASDIDTLLKSGTAPAVAIFNFVLRDNAGIIMFNDGSSLTPDALIEKLNKRIIPAFRVTSAGAADALAAYLKANDLRDAYAVSDDIALVKRACDGWVYLRGIADYSSSSVSNMEALHSEANTNGVRVLILNTNVAVYENVQYLQDRFLQVWTTVVEGDAASVAAINNGVSGIITPDTDVTAACFTKYYPTNTLTRRPNIIGHRGVPSMAQENSLAGAALAYELGATMVENDIYRLADDVLIVMHDTTLDRTTTGSGNVRGYTYAQIGQYKIDVTASLAAEPIPTLEDYFKAFKGNGKTIVIELKSSDTGVAKPLADLIAKHDIADQIVVISFYPQVIAAVRTLCPGISGGYLTSAIALDESDTLGTAQAILESVQSYDTVFNPSYAGGSLGYGILRELSYRGVSVWPWTVNSQAAFDQYFVWGTYGITTNYSQWVSGYTSRLTFAEKDGKYTVSAVQYDGTVKDVTSSVKLVAVDDGGMELKYSGGTVSSANGAGGTAQVFFRLDCKTASGNPYSVVTALTSVSVEAQGNITADATTAEPDIPETSSAAESSAEQSGDVTGGCGSILALPVMIIALPAALAVRKRGKPEYSD